MLILHFHPVLTLSFPLNLEPPPSAPNMRPHHHLFWFNVSVLYIILVFQAVSYLTIDNRSSGFLRGAGHPLITRTVLGQEAPSLPLFIRQCNRLFPTPGIPFQAARRLAPAELCLFRDLTLTGSLLRVSWAEHAPFPFSLPYLNTPRDIA